MVILGVVVQLHFRNTKLTIELELSGREVAQHQTPSRHWFTALEALIAERKQAGAIDSYLIHWERFKSVWRDARAVLGKDFSKVHRFVVAEGAPVLNGVRVKRRILGAFDGKIGQIWIRQNPEVVATWLPEWLVVHVKASFPDRGARVLDASVYNAWFFASTVETEEAMPLFSNRKTGHYTTYPFPGGGVLVDFERGFAYLKVTKPAAFSKISAGEVRRRVSDIAAHMTTRSGRKCSVLTRGIMEVAARASRQEFVEDSHLPIISPIVLSLPRHFVLNLEERLPDPSEESTGSQQGAATGIQDPDSLYTIQIAVDGMTATCLRATREKSPNVRIENVLASLQKHGVVHGIDGGQCQRVVDLLRSGIGAFEVVLARATPPASGADPYLDIGARQADGMAVMPGNFRREFFANQEVIARVQFRSPPKDGVDVLGRVLPAPASRASICSAGDGVAEKSPGVFVATRGGKVRFAEQVLSVEAIAVREGDVTVATGILCADGSLEIKGSIEAGAVVNVQGDLIVQGDVRGALIKVGGNLLVAGGIRLANKGLLVVKGNLQGNFIEESRVFCHGNLALRRGIVSAQIFAGGDVAVAPEGSSGIFGGRIVTRKGIDTLNLGRATSPLTIVEAGADVFLNVRLSILRERQKRVSQRLNKDREELGYIKQKSKTQRSEKHDELERALKGRIARQEKICEILAKRIEQRQSQSSIDDRALVLVRGLLSTNVKISIGNVSVPIAAEFQGARVSARMSRGSNISAIDEVKEAG